MENNEKYLAQNLAIDKSQTPEKFQHHANEVIDFLTGILYALDCLEQEVFQRHKLLKEKRTASHLAHPDEKGLWQEYHERCNAIIAPVSATPYTDKRSFGKPVHYEYITRPDTKITFIMKSAGKAIVAVLYQHGITKEEQFVLKSDSGGWKLDSKKYKFPREKTWHKDTF